VYEALKEDDDLPYYEDLGNTRNLVISQKDELREVRQDLITTMTKKIAILFKEC
jgi:hypothetical protein